MQVALQTAEVCQSRRGRESTRLHTSAATRGRLPRCDLLGADKACCAGVGGVSLLGSGCTVVLLRACLPLLSAEAHHMVQGRL